MASLLWGERRIANTSLQSAVDLLDVGYEFVAAGLVLG